MREKVTLAYATPSDSTSPTKPPPLPLSKIRRSEHSRVQEAVKAIALCHNVTPVWEPCDETQSEADQHYNIERQPQSRAYQASSPDEVCLYV